MSISITIRFKLTTRFTFQYLSSLFRRISILFFLFLPISSNLVFFSSNIVTSTVREVIYWDKLDAQLISTKDSFIFHGRKHRACFILRPKIILVCFFRFFCRVCVCVFFVRIGCFTNLCKIGFSQTVFFSIPDITNWVSNI